MSFFPIKAKDYNKEGQKASKKSYINNSNKTKLPMTKAQGDKYQLDKLGKIQIHKIDKVKEEQQKRQIELRNKILDVFGIINLHIPVYGVDLEHDKKWQKKAYKLVKEAYLFDHEVEIMPFLKTFIFPDKTRGLK